MKREETENIIINIGTFIGLIFVCLFACKVTYDIISMIGSD
jgi:hypothetical protein